MPFVRANGIQLYYRLQGEGPRLLYISGTGGDLRLHPNPLDYPLARGFTMLAYDQRGLGQSEKPDRPYSMADYADDAAGLMAALGWGRCLVVGYSFGGMVAQELALRHPRRVERLVLMSTTSGGAGGSSYPLHELAGLPLEQRARRAVELADLRRDASWQKEHPDEFRRLVEQTLAAMSLGADEPGHQIGAQRQLQARRSHDTYRRLAGLDLPVLVAAGRYDGIAPLECQKALQEAIPGARLRVFEGGHQFFLQDPTAFERIRDFLLA